MTKEEDRKRRAVSVLFNAEMLALEKGEHKLAFEIEEARLILLGEIK